GTSMFILMSGQAAVSIADSKVAEVLPGQVFGEMSLLSGQPRSATVTAEVQSELLEIDRVAFKTVLNTNPAIADEIARIVAERRAQNARALESGGMVETVPAEPEGGFLGRFKAFFEIS
ncbi:MAG TPA: cyclic nucleotide-binding domain-containing protein, partial [Stenomitos sp.]